MQHQRTHILPRSPFFTVRHVALACALLMAGMPTVSLAALALAQSPPNNGGSEPAPNVIITVDDSGSMGQTVDEDEHHTTQTTKIAALKNALTAQFVTNTQLVPDNRIRLGWQAMHDNGNTSHSATTITAGSANSIKLLDSTRRSTFSTWINSLTGGGYTPSHQMMDNVFSYLRAAPGINSPWAAVPGTTELPYLGCRRTYHIFMTDGEWNGNNGNDPTNNQTNLDGVTKTLPDGVAYNPNTACAYNSRNETCVYADAWGGTANKPSTLADLAFKAWSTDLQDGTGTTQNISNGIIPRIKQPGPQTVANPVTTSGHTSYTLPEYWNPRNDPATWQHVTQYTIGFFNASDLGNSGLMWDGVPLWDSTGADDNYGGDYAKLVNGEVRWQDVISTNHTRSSELWHMALNGRGKFYPARSAAALSAAFADILDNIIVDTSQPFVSIAANSSTLRTNASYYLAGYAPATWAGQLLAYPIDATTAAVGSVATWDARALLDAAGYSVANRFVMSYDSTLGTPAGSAPAGIEWKTYANLPSAQKTPLNKNSLGTVDSNGQNRVDYIRGDRTKEASQTGGIFRTRASRLGDIVNSNILYLGKPASGYTANNYANFRAVSSLTNPGGKGGRTPMIYIGANDGMLHGFSANDGTEKIAYIPQGIAEGNLRKLTDTTYSHQYFVDGTPFSGDAYIGSTPAWTTVLVGTLGAGGKGYFILDATDPANFSASNVASLVIKDTTATTDPDIGVITSPPVLDDAVLSKSRQIVKMNNGKWAAVMGNGYNSTNEAPVLLIQYLDGTKGLVKVSPCTLTGTPLPSCSYKGNNGLSSPQLIDLNGDGKVDVAYAGDLKGNVWKFDLSSATDTNWTMAFKNTSGVAQPFFVAKTSASVAQSITTAPYWMAHPKGGIMISVGTGQNLTTADLTTTGTETLYGLYDNSTFTVNASTGVMTLVDGTPINTTSSTGIPTTLVQQSITGSSVSGGTTYFSSSSNAVDFSTKRGWYMNMTISGERVLHNPKAFYGQDILVQTTVPKTGGVGTESCTASATIERSFLTVVNLFTGAPAVTPVFTTADISKIEKPPGDTVLIWDPETGYARAPSVPGPTGTPAPAPIPMKTGHSVGLRVDWREVQ